MIVLSASQLLVVAAVVAVSVVVLWLAVDVAVLWLVVAVVLSVESVLNSLSLAIPVQSIIVVFVVVQVFVSGPDPLHQSFSAGDTMRTCSFAHLIAVAPCETHRLLPSTPMTLAGHISSVIQGISQNVVTTHWSEPSNQALSDLRVRFHFNRCHPTLVSVLGLFPEPARRRQEWQICVLEDRTGSNDPTKPLSQQVSIVLHRIVFRICQLVQQLLDINLANDHVFHRWVLHHAKISCMVLNLPHVPVSLSRNCAHKDSTFFGLIKELPGDLCAMGSTLRHFGAPAQRSQPCAKVFHSA